MRRTLAPSFRHRPDAWRARAEQVLAQC